MKLRFLLPVGLLLLSPCGDPGGPPGSALRREGGGVLLGGTGTVLEGPQEGPVLCLGAVLESFPPQCDGPRIQGWGWDLVEGEESASGVVWGHYEVTGYFDGQVFTVATAGAPRRTPYVEGVTTPCPKPEGGWRAPDPGRSSQRERDRAIRGARREPDFAGAWIDGAVLNLAFTGDLGRHGREGREGWGGPLCLIRHEHTLERLRSIRADLDENELGLDVLWSSVNEMDNVVELGVVVADREIREEIGRRYGAGTVRVEAALEPVG